MGVRDIDKESAVLLAVWVSKCLVKRSTYNWLLPLEQAHYLAVAFP